MGDVFLGWRRKTGLVVLVLSLALTCGWLRSRFQCDQVWISVVNRRHHVLSLDDMIVWQACDISGEWFSVRCWSHPLTPPAGVTSDEWIARGWRSLSYELRQSSGHGEWKVPYWTVVIPSTVLSAFLILWKTRSEAKTRHSASGSHERTGDEK